MPAENSTGKDVKRFLRMANCLSEARKKCTSSWKGNCTARVRGASKVLAVCCVSTGSLLYTLDGPRLQRLCRLPRVAESIRLSAEDPDQEEIAPAVLR